jgi:predicted NBD/HSP70 family sugar kinase
LATASGLSIVTVAGILGQLVASGEAREVDLVPSAGGRPSRQFEFNADHALVLVTLARESQGRDTVSFRVANLYGHCLATEDVPMTPQSLGDFEPWLDAMMARYPHIRGLGFGLPGMEVEGRIVALDYNALVGAPILDHFQRRYGLPVHFENDVNAAVAGWAKRFPNRVGSACVYLYFPEKYPPGAGLLIEGRLWRGRRRFAGEVAFVPLDVPWGEPRLYTDFDALCRAIARVIAAVCAVINPDTVVLSGEFLTGTHQEAIEDVCRRLLPANALPQTVLSQEFSLDFQAGLIETTLALLEPKNP